MCFFARLLFYKSDNYLLSVADLLFTRSIQCWLSFFSILIFCDNVTMEFSGQDAPAFKGTKQGRVYLTTHRMIFNNKKDSDPMQSFSFPFVTLNDVSISIGFTLRFSFRRCSLSVGLCLVSSAWCVSHTPRSLVTKSRLRLKALLRCMVSTRSKYIFSYDMHKHKANLKAAGRPNHIVFD